MRKIPTLVFLITLFPIPFLSGCAAIALTLVQVGAGIATGQAVSYTLEGTAYRTFTVPLPQLRRATLIALNRMGIKVEAQDETDLGELFKATGDDRQIEVELEALSPMSTRMRTLAKKGFFFKDRATAVEIISQTESVLSGA